MAINIRVDIDVEEINQQLAELREMVGTVLANQVTESVTDAIQYEQLGEDMANIDLQITAAQSAIAAQGTVIDSAREAFIALRSDLVTVRDELLAAGVTEDQLAALDALDDGVLANTEALAAAVASGTAAEGETPTGEPVTPDNPGTGTNTGGTPDGGTPANPA